MELGKTTLDALSLGHQSGNINDDTFTKVLDFVYHSISATFPDKATENSQFSALFGLTLDQFQAAAARPQPTPLLQFYTGLTTVLVEAARFDVSVNELKSVLDDKLDEDRLGQVLTAFKQHNGETRFQLALHSVNFSQLVGFSWRLDYNVHSNAMEDMREQSYILTFVVLDQNTNEKREITCQADLAQMNALQAQMKNAIAKKI